jgi:hypothetical protein
MSGTFNTGISGSTATVSSGHDGHDYGHDDGHDGHDDGHDGHDY